MQWGHIRLIDETTRNTRSALASNIWQAAIGAATHQSATDGLEATQSL
jgi:hypothetical protein